MRLVEIRSFRDNWSAVSNATLAEKRSRLHELIIEAARQVVPTSPFGTLVEFPTGIAQEAEQLA